MATYDLTSTTPSKIKTGDILNCSYSGSAKQITLHSGKYKLECWGAQGGGNSSSPGGNGGYSTGIIILNSKQNIYLYTGGAGGNAIAGFNGGGSVPSSSRYISGGGGGASDVRIGSDSLYARIIVAGGGGGGESESPGYYGGAGGGQSGLSGRGFGSYGPGTGGSQTTGGSSAYGGTNNQGMSFSASSFGQGASITGASSSNSGYIGGAGGGGWYGGGAGGAVSGGGGGSGYVYTSSTASNYPSGCLLNSSYYLTDAQTTAGNTAFTSPTGTNETGHTGNGYIRITVIEASSGNTLVKTTSNTWKEQKQMFVNTGVSTTVPSGLVELEYIQSSGTQYIDTGFKPNQNTRVVVDAKPLNVTQATYWCIFGVRTNIYFELYKASTSTMKLTFLYNSTYSQGFDSVDYAKRQIFEINKNVATVDGNSLTYPVQTFQQTRPLFLLATNNNGVASGIAASQLYSAKIYDNNTLVRDFIPAKRISDGKCGLWDKVNFKFYTDESSGNFTAGAEKTAIAAIGTPLEYIEATGTQYINTKIPANTVSKVITDFQFTSITSGTESEIMAVYVDDNNRMQCGYHSGADFSQSYTGATTTYSQLSSLTARTTGTSTPLGSPSLTIYLFGQNQSNTLYHPSKAKIYSCKMYKNGKLDYDFIPIKTTTNIYGLWDKVNKIFYPNAGTGTFTAGPTITLTGWHKIKGIWAKTTANTWSQAL